MSKSLRKLIIYLINEKILITGGSGFIGTNLIEHLLKKQMPNFLLSILMSLKSILTIDFGNAWILESMKS